MVSHKTIATPAVVLGMFETGLAVGRSLGRAGIRVFGFDFSKKIGFYSRYIQSALCPHPVMNERGFISFLIRFASSENIRPALFITSDEFLLAITRNREELEPYYLMNLPDQIVIESIVDKYKQYKLAMNAGIPVPRTFFVDSINTLLEMKDQITFPAFIKGVEVITWRRNIGTDVKGFVIYTQDELMNTFEDIFKRQSLGIIQEIIPGPDTNHFKASCYLSRKNEILLEHGLQKIRQHPPGYGFGCLVKSIENQELLALGRTLFTKIGYRGVGSAEFKLDQRDGKLKLIEINPRYWQQNSLAERCGMNFPLIDYMELIGQEPKPVSDYRCGIKWLNIYADFDSFRVYRGRKQLTIAQWLQSLKGEKILSDLVWDDLLPGLRELVLKNVLRRAARFLANRLWGSSADHGRLMSQQRGTKDTR